MSVAIMVLAHSCTSALERYVPLLDPEQFEVYLHVDRKAPLDGYAPLSQSRNVSFVPDRRSVFWGGFSMVQATLSLLRCALQRPENTHFLLVSDDAIPTLPGNDLYRRISSAGIRMTSHVCLPGSEPHARYANYFHFDSSFTTPRWLPAESRYIDEGSLAFVNELQVLRRRGKFPVQIFAGPQWWCLPRDVAEFCLEQYDNNDWLVESFRFSAIPDEIYFHTLAAMHSGAAPPSEPCPVYADFSREPKPYVFGALEEIPAFGDSTLFLRKVKRNGPFLDMYTEKFLRG